MNSDAIKFSWKGSTATQERIAPPPASAKSVRVVEPDILPTLEGLPHILDLRGTMCPVPVLRTQYMMQRMLPGAALCVMTTDPHSAKDVPAFAIRKGHDLYKFEELPGMYIFWLRTASSPPSP